MDTVGLEGLIAGSAKPMTKVRGQDQSHARLQLHEFVVTLQPSLAIALQYRDRLEIGMRVSGGFVTGRRILNADADGRRALCVADKRQIGRSAFNGSVAMSLWRTIGIVRSPITVVIHVEGGQWVT